MRKSAFASNPQTGRVGSQSPGHHCTFRMQATVPEGAGDPGRDSVLRGGDVAVLGVEARVGGPCPSETDPFPWLSTGLLQVEC